MRTDEPDAIDRVLEAALSRYSSEQPLAGLEQRVLQRVRAAGGRPRYRLWQWAWAAGGALAAGLFAMAMVWMKPVPFPARVFVPLAKPAPLLAHEEPFRKRSIRATPARLPRLPEFPRRAPITAQERTLLALATRAPKEALEAFLELRKRGTEPIPLQEITIEPIRRDDVK